MAIHSPPAPLLSLHVVLWCLQQLVITPSPSPSPPCYLVSFNFSLSLRLAWVGHESEKDIKHWLYLYFLDFLCTFFPISSHLFLFSFFLFALLKSLPPIGLEQLWNARRSRIFKCKTSFLIIQMQKPFRELAARISPSREIWFLPRGSDSDSAPIKL